MLIKKKFLGVFNIIDILIIAFIFIAGIVGYRTFFTEAAVVENISARQETFIMKFYTEDVPDFVANAIRMGDNLQDELRSTDLGTVIDLDIRQGFAFMPNSEGELLVAAKQGYSSVEITSEAQGELFDNGVLIRGNIYGVGHSFTLRAGSAKLFVRVSAIERIE